jgi:hypothetical protein
LSWKKFLAAERMECDDCGRSFSCLYNLNRHLRSGVHSGGKRAAEGEEHGGKLKCDQCDAKFFRRDNLERHKKKEHEVEGRRLTFRCGLCDAHFHERDALELHRRENHVLHNDFRLEQSAHAKQCQLLRAVLPARLKTLDEGLFYSYDQVRKLISSLSAELDLYKLNFILHVELYKLGEDGSVSAVQVFPFRGNGMKITRESDVPPELRRVMGDVERNVDEFLFQGSGWIVSRPLFMEAEVVQCLPLTGRSCGLHVAVYTRGKGVVPAKLGEADDGMCFYYAVASHFCGPSATDSELAGFLFDEVRGDVSQMELKNIVHFERANERLDLNINVVYRDERGTLLPVRAGKNINARNNIVLLLFHTTFWKEAVSHSVMHYSLIRDPASIFARRRLTNGRSRSNRVFICWNCHNYMYRKSTYERHVAFCHRNDCQRVTLPEEGETLHFDSHDKAVANTFRSAFMLFFDFEALQVPARSECTCSEEVLDNTRELEGMTEEERARMTVEHSMLEGEVMMEWEGRRFEALQRGATPSSKPPSYPRRLHLPKVCPHKTKVVTDQPPFAYSYVLVDRDGRVREDKVYVGEDAADNFVLSVIGLSQKYLPELTPGKKMNQLTAEERRRALAVDMCYLCHRLLEDGDRVLDHDHLNGRFLGVAHNGCNLKRREKITLTCFAHNFTGYDSHFIIKAVNKYAHMAGQISAIPMNTQKFKAISLSKRINFVDSCAFLLDSLANLVDTQVKSGSSFSILQQLVPDADERKLLLRKGVYPYAFATSEERLREASSLPDRSEFFNDLRDEDCSEEDHRHARRVWETFGCRNMIDYTTLYVRTDSYLLAEVMMDLRNNVWDCFGLDLCQYLSLPHLAKDIMLKQTGVEIDLIHDHEMSDLLKRNIRGGLSFVNVRHAEKKEAPGTAHLPYHEDRRSLVYLDANNLYGQSMRYPMPVSDFTWMSEEEVAAFDAGVDVTSADGTGYILEVDLDYPEELHLKHNSLPLAPESMLLGWEELSGYSQECLRVLRDPSASLHSYEAKKLSSTFRKREKYLVHGLNLKLYLELGLKLKFIHRGIKFQQRAFIRPFIDECTERRRLAATITVANMWKLICNSLYGKVSNNNNNNNNNSSCLFSLLTLSLSLSRSSSRRLTSGWTAASTAPGRPR